MLEANDTLAELRANVVNMEVYFQEFKKRMKRVHVHLHNRCVSVAKRVDKRYNEILRVYMYI